MSPIISDIDFFKAYNGTYGHQAGDHCLQQVARAISLAAKRPAVVARYGGEEFVVVLPNTEVEGALRVAHEIRANLRALEIIHPNSQISQYVTLSFGVASVIPSQETFYEMLVSTADRALYQAKTARDTLAYS